MHIVHMTVLRLDPELTGATEWNCTVAAKKPRNIVREKALRLESTECNETLI